MKQKVFSWGDDFVIRDAMEREVYQVVSRLLTLGNKLSFQDMQGNELAFISQELFSWGPKYRILRGGQELAVVEKKLFTFFNCKFTVDVPGPNDLEASGDFMDHEYVFTRGGTEVARVSKEWFTWSDTYGIDIANGEDDVLLLASAVVIDMCCHDDRD